MNPQLALDQIADAILDGMPVDWSPLDSIDATGPHDKVLLDQLRTLETLRRQRRAAEVKTPGHWTWGHLRVLERVGQGAYGDVYRAWDTRLDREVALKLLPPEAPSGGPSQSTIIEEGRLLARVRHPNVVTIHGAERIDGSAGLWMEFIKGRTLEQALRDGRKFTANEITRLGVTLSQAVSAVHAAGLLHRDLKAQNVMIDDAGRLVLMDFGTGRELDKYNNSVEPIAGTPLYLAPEILSGAPATPQSEVYSIGVVLFRLLTNAYPVSAADLASLRQAHADAGDARSRADRAEIPKRLRTVLAQALDPDPARRQADAGALAKALSATARTSVSRRLGYLAAAVVAIVAVVATGWTLGLRERLSPALIALGVMEPPTIAVLPFRDAGSDSDQAGFIDGLTLEVIDDLASIKGLQVISQESSFYFKDRPDDPYEAGRKLRADFVVQATVKRVGNRLLLYAQLGRVHDQAVMWSQPYDRTIDDAVKIQADISREIVNKLRLTLGSGQRRYETSKAAYDLYVQGRLLVLRHGTTSAEAAVPIFERVITMDRNFTPAYAGLAAAYAAWSWQLDGISNEAALAGMRPAAERALQLDPMSAEAHAAMGLTRARELDWEGARRYFEDAMKYDPSTDVRQQYAFSTLLPTGHAAQAETLLSAARELDPFSPALQRELGIAQYVQGRYEDAIASFRQALAIDPTYFAVNQLLARALIQAGQPGQAIEVYESRPQNKGWERWILAAYNAVGRTADVDRLVAENKDAEPHRQAIMHAALGNKDATIEALNRATESIPAPRVALFLQWPDFALVRGDARLEPLKQRLNLK